MSVCAWRAAIFIKPLPFIEVDVEALDQAVRAGTPDRKLTGSGWGLSGGMGGFDGLRQIACSWASCLSLR